jgi:hypothetical protein
MNPKTRKQLEQVLMFLLMGKLRVALAKLNPAVPADARDSAVKIF